MATSANDQISEWLQTLQSSATQSARDDPNYWTTNPESLISSANIEQILFGTGESIYENAILPAIAQAEEEVILVTCFWARSPTLTSLSQILVNLSDRALQRGCKIKVRICFSSLSIFQKLTQTSSLDGKVWPPESWERKLGLPGPERLRGLEMCVKSVFVLPFSVMHPKFVLVDRKKVLVPSCNVSWERWFEGAVVLSGAVVRQFVKFYEQFWERKKVLEAEIGGGEPALVNADSHGVDLSTPNGYIGQIPKPLLQKSDSTFLWTLSNLQQHGGRTGTIFLPSPHHRNPRFSFLPWRSCPPPPPTPLNTFILSIVRNASHHIYVQTPNLTAPPVLSALLEALKCGVDVEILTSERLMILEQLGTAGTTTKRCVNKLVKRHKRLILERNRKTNDWTSSEIGASGRPGKLTISFFQPNKSDTGEGKAEPTQSHFKFMSVDDEWMVFGSGNMDRASWFTSQELGVAFHSHVSSDEVGMNIGAEVLRCLKGIMETRRKVWYDGGVEAQGFSRTGSSNG